jgi:hypothetical protein
MKGNFMANQIAAGWCFVVAGVVLLGTSGRLDALSVLIPVSLLLAVVLLAGCDRNTPLSGQEKKG